MRLEIYDFVSRIDPDRRRSVGISLYKEGEAGAVGEIGKTANRIVLLLKRVFTVQIPQIPHQQT